jgi:hypothetical protein
MFTRLAFLVGLIPEDLVCYGYCPLAPFVLLKFYSLHRLFPSTWAVIITSHHQPRTATVVAPHACTAPPIASDNDAFRGLVSSVV